MKLYSNLNLFFINAFTLLTPRFLHPPVAFLTGGIFYLILAKVRKSVRENLRTVTGRADVEKLVLLTFYRFSRNWTDIMLMMRLRGKKLHRLIGRGSGGHHLEEALARGNGAILISPHLGNWELGGLGLADQGYKVNVLTFREPDEKVNELRERVRSERGIRFIYVDRFDTSPLAIIEAVNALRRNEILAMLGDRDGSSHTAALEFFGRMAEIPLGAAYLAVASGAPVLPVFVPIEGSRYATIMEAPIYITGGHGTNKSAVREGTQKILKVFEKYIATHPDQWYNFFDYWGRTETREEKGI
jgi:KDO2-lipid IV(A) lauroyltransferase